MNLSPDFQTVLTVAGFVIGIYSAWVIGKSKTDRTIIDTTVKDLKDAVETRDLRLKDSDERAAIERADHQKQITDLQEGYNKKIETMSKDIASLQAEVGILKNIPLTSIDNTLKKIDNTMYKVLEALKTSAVLLVADTKEAADAVNKVKTDLAGHQPIV